MSAGTRCTRPEQAERLAAYELGALPLADRAAFEAHLDQCESCLEQLYELAPSIAALLEEPGRAAALLEVQPVTERVPAAGVAGWRSRLAALLDRAIGSPGLGHAWAPVAALALLFLLLIVPDHPRRLAPGFGSLAQLEPAPFMQVETRSAATAETERLFRQGMELYVAGRYAQAALLLRQAVDAGTPADERRLLDQSSLYLGVCLLLSGSSAEAVPALEQAATSLLRPLADRSRWYLGQALLLEDDPRGAASQLRELAERSPVYGQPAGEQLNALWRMMIERDIELPRGPD